MSATWRPMAAADLPAVMRIAAGVHPDYPEDQAVFAERRRLSPAGCLCLVQSGAPAGYVVSHRWHRGRPPALNTLLGAIPADAANWYIHDLAILPEARGGGAAGRIVRHLADLARAAGCSSLSLVAVADSPGFWRRHGFRVAQDDALAGRLASYDDVARYMIRELDH